VAHTELLRVATAGPATIPSPVRTPTFVPDGAHLRLPVEIGFRQPGGLIEEELLLERAGPREHIRFDPARSRAAVVTCGGLCPGINNVIRSLVLQLHHHYGVRDIVGVRHGFAGFTPDAPAPPVQLTPASVEGVQRFGGTMLGSSRGPVPPGVIVDWMEREGVNLLFAIGGDGTQKGVHRIALEVLDRGMDAAVVGIPKTVDNDIPFVWRSFGYYTALERAREVITSAHTEALGAWNGISIVKLMGREAGFIAAGATLASQEVNVTLIPEVPFALEGETGLLAHLERRMASRHHAVIVVAEGAGQDLLPPADGHDASGNRRFNDIGVFLRDRIAGHFRDRGVPVSVKYMDPSYYIRSVPAESDDALLCDQLARHAAHAAMAGRTDMLLGQWYGVFVHVPLDLVTGRVRRVGPHSDVWAAVLAATGQPGRFGAPGPAGG
jgi:6-phosphofructokinase 1